MQMGVLIRMKIYLLYLSIEDKKILNNPYLLIKSYKELNPSLITTIVLQ